MGCPRSCCNCDLQCAPPLTEVNAAVKVAKRCLTLVSARHQPHRFMLHGRRLQTRVDCDQMYGSM